MNKLDKIFWWLNEHELVRFLIVISLTPMMEICLRFGYVGAFVLLIYTIALVVFAFAWTQWVNCQRAHLADD